MRISNSDTYSFSQAIKIETIKMVHRAKASHIGGAFSMVDILAVLYGNLLNIDPNNIFLPTRDRFILSKGHACSSLYATLALKGFYPLNFLDSFGSDGSMFTAHTSHLIPGVEFSSGSLGHGLPYGCGVALAGKRKGCNWKTIVLLSDGELDEGSNWEAILFAAHQQLKNLIIFIDYNKIQSFGTVEEVLNLEPLLDKFKAFGWSVCEIDGHNHSQIANSFLNCGMEGKPSVIVANTIKGKGITFMENQLLWHYKSPSDEELRNALNQISGENRIY